MNVAQYFVCRTLEANVAEIKIQLIAQPCNECRLTVCLITWCSFVIKPVADLDFWKMGICVGSGSDSQDYLV